MSRKMIDLTGREFGTLKVMCQGHRDDGNCHNAYWVVECTICHTAKIVRSDNLLSGKVVSCGRCSKLKAKNEVNDLGVMRNFDENMVNFGENMTNDLGVIGDFSENDLGV